MLMGMGDEQMISTVAAVLLANLLTAWAVYSAFTIHRKWTYKPSHAPWHVLLGLVIPFFVGAFGFYLVAASAG